MASDPALRPGPGKSTADAAFDLVKKKIAEQNEKASSAARKTRDAKASRKTAERRAREAL